MSRFSPESLRLEVSDESANLFHQAWRRGWQRCAALALAPSHRFQGDALLAQLPGLFEGQARKARLSVILPDKAARYFMVTPPRNLTRFADLKAVAGLRLESLLGLSASDWHIEADWQLDRPFLAVALPKPLLEELQAFAVARGIRLIAVEPALAARWNQTRARLKAGDWLASCGSERAIIAVAGAQDIAAVFPLDLAADWRTQPAALQPALDSALYRLQVPPPARVHLTSDRPLAWHQATLGATALLAWPPALVPGAGGANVAPATDDFARPAEAAE